MYITERGVESASRLSEMLIDSPTVISPDESFTIRAPQLTINKLLRPLEGDIHVSETNETAISNLLSKYTANNVPIHILQKALVYHR